MEEVTATNRIKIFNILKDGYLDTGVVLKIAEYLYQNFGDNEFFPFVDQFGVWISQMKM